MQGRKTRQKEKEGKEGRERERESKGGRRVCLYKHYRQRSQFTTESILRVTRHVYADFH